MTGTRALTTALLTLMLLGSSGCEFPPSRDWVQQIVDKGERDLKAHDENISKQHEIMSPAVAKKIAEQRQQFLTAMEASKKEYQEKIDKIEAKEDAAGRQLATTVAKLLGLGEVVDLLLPKVDAANEKATTAKNKAENVKIAAGETKAKVDKMHDVMTKLSEETRVSLAKLEGFDPEKFEANLKKQQELIVGKEGAELKAAILEEAKAAAIPIEMLAKLEGMTSEQLLGLVGTGGAGSLLGLFALFRSFGPSRSQRQTDILNQMMDSLKEELDRVRGEPVASGSRSKKKRPTGEA